MKVISTSVLSILLIQLVWASPSEAIGRGRFRLRRAPAAPVQPARMPQSLPQAVPQAAPAQVPAAQQDHGGGNVNARFVSAPVETKKRDEAPAKVATLTTYIPEGRRLSDTVFQFRSGDGTWANGLYPQRAQKDGAFLNANGERVEYKAGDILFQTLQNGWFVAKADTRDLSDKASEETVPNPLRVPISELQTYIVHYSNIKRMSEGLPPLTVSPSLMSYSQQKSANMARQQNLSHRGVAPDPQTISAAENIAWNQNTAKGVVQNWYDSPGHKVNLMNPAHLFIGTGVAVGNGPYWTQQFWESWAVPGGSQEASLLRK